MKKNVKDEFLEEIDQELRTLNKRLRDVMSDADTLLSQHFGKAEQDESSDKDASPEVTAEKEKVSLEKEKMEVPKVS